jgi:hypothetical protein
MCARHLRREARLFLRHPAASRACAAQTGEASDAREREPVADEIFDIVRQTDFA